VTPSRRGEAPEQARARAGTNARPAPARARAGRNAAPTPARVRAILDALARHDPEPRCALDYATPYELIAAVILSAQCTDKRVNLVTPALFARYPDPAALAAAEQADVEELVRTTGFFRNKAKNLIGMARGLCERFGGQVPRAMDELLSLPGVARKTANVVRGEAYGLADGVTVDTHVLRLSGRLGLTRQLRLEPYRPEHGPTAIRAYAAAGFARATPEEEAVFNTGQRRLYVWMRDVT